MNVVIVPQPKRLNAGERLYISGTLSDGIPEFQICNWKIKGIQSFELCQKDGMNCVQINGEFFITRDSIYHKDKRIESLDYLKGDVGWEDWNAIKSRLIKHV